MNDQCAVGTGRFLEIMAASLGYSLAEFGEATLAAEDGVTLDVNRRRRRRGPLNPEF